jgi:hypothetical protein
VLTVAAPAESLLRDIPPPAQIHHRIGELLREVALLRRLLRLALAAQRAAAHAQTGQDRQEVTRA